MSDNIKMINQSIDNSGQQDILMQNLEKWDQEALALIQLQQEKIDDI